MHKRVKICIADNKHTLQLEYTLQLSKAILTKTLQWFFGSFYHPFKNLIFVPNWLCSLELWLQHLFCLQFFETGLDFFQRKISSVILLNEKNVRFSCNLRQYSVCECKDWRSKGCVCTSVHEYKVISELFMWCKMWDSRIKLLYSLHAI